MSWEWKTSLRLARNETSEKSVKLRYQGIKSSSEVHLRGRTQSATLSEAVITFVHEQETLAVSLVFYKGLDI